MRWRRCPSTSRAKLDATRRAMHVSWNAHRSLNRFMNFFHSTVYIKATAILCVITLITDAISTLLTGIGLKTLDANLKYRFYRIAVYVMIVSLLSLLIALILYPVRFAAELSQGNRNVWEFGWAYGLCECFTIANSIAKLNFLIPCFRLGRCDIPVRRRRSSPVRQGIRRNLLQGAQDCSRDGVRSWLEIFVPAWSVDLSLIIRPKRNAIWRLLHLILSAKIWRFEVCFWVQNY